MPMLNALAQPGILLFPTPSTMLETPLNNRANAINPITRKALNSGNAITRPARTTTSAPIPI